MKKQKPSSKTHHVLSSKLVEITTTRRYVSLHCPRIASTHHRHHIQSAPRCAGGPLISGRLSQGMPHLTLAFPRARQPGNTDTSNLGKAHCLDTV